MYVHKYGVEVTERDWKDRGANGQVVTTYRDGTTARRTYLNGILHGVTTYTFPHSTIVRKTEVYEMGRLSSKLSHFHSGIPRKEVSYLAPGHEKQTLWYEDGTPQSVEETLDGKVLAGEYFTPTHEVEAAIADGDGMRVRRDPYGNLFARELVQEGDMVEQTTYYPNGDPQTVSHFCEGVLEGEKKTFFLGGEPNTVEEWSHGFQHGKTTLYQNGQKKAEMSYHMGKKQGLERHFDDNGRVVEEISWNAGRKHGPCRLWVDGIVNTEWYENDSQVSQAQFESPRHLH